MADDKTPEEVEAEVETAEETEAREAAKDPITTTGFIAVLAGILAAVMAGSWLGLVQGFAGLRWPGGRASFRPQLPARWQGYAFRLWLRGAQIEVAVTTGGVAYHLLHGEAARFLHHGMPQRLDAGTPLLHLPLHP